VSLTSCPLRKYTRSISLVTRRFYDHVLYVHIEKDPLEIARLFHSNSQLTALLFGVLLGSIRTVPLLLPALGILQEFPLLCQRRSNEVRMDFGCLAYLMKLSSSEL
jgi:hypothetical protein